MNRQQRRAAKAMARKEPVNPSPRMTRPCDLYEAAKQQEQPP